MKGWAASQLEDLIYSCTQSRQPGSATAETKTCFSLAGAGIVNMAERFDISASQICISVRRPGLHNPHSMAQTMFLHT